MRKPMKEPLVEHKSRPKLRLPALPAPAPSLPTPVATLPEPVRRTGNQPLDILRALCDAGGSNTIAAIAGQTGIAGEEVLRLCKGMAANRYMLVHSADPLAPTRVEITDAGRGYATSAGLAVAPARSPEPVLAPVAAPSTASANERAVIAPTRRQLKKIAACPATATQASLPELVGAPLSLHITVDASGPLATALIQAVREALSAR